MKKLLFSLYIAVLGAFLCVSAAQAGTYVAKYNSTLSRSEKQSICNQLQNASQSTSSERNGLGGGVIPDEVLTSIYNTTQKISNSIMLVSILGDTLMCHSVHAAKNNVEIFGVYLGSYPNIPIWLCGAVIYFFGFMLLLSITFYVIDISFKLGFAIILMPIGIALWPFEKTKDKIVILISIFLKSAGIFAFLAITVAYTVGMLSEALSGLKDVFEAIAQNDTDYVQETFTLDATTFLLVVTGLAYGMKLIGSTIPQYVDKFFPDKAFGSASPMHHLSTQAMDFAKKKVVAPVATFAGNVAETQVGKGVEKIGKFARGGYHEDLKTGVKNIGRAWRNKKQTLQKVPVALDNLGDKISGGIEKNLNNLKYGAQIAGASIIPNKENRNAYRDALRNERNEKNQAIDETIAQNYADKMGQINQTIDRREQLRADDKQREHEEKMRNDPAYREQFEEKQREAEAKRLKHEARLAKINEINNQLKDIDAAKEATKVKTENVYGAMNDFADKIKNGKGTTRLLQGIKNRKENTFNRIENGRFAEKPEDGWFKTGYKALARGTEKMAVSLGWGVAQAPLAVVSGAVNAGVETVNSVAKIVAGAGMGSYNGVVSGIYGLKKVWPKMKKTYHSMPEIAGDILRAPGTVIEGVGQSMQHHKKKK